jgi:hypothetical protein
MKQPTRYYHIILAIGMVVFGNWCCTKSTSPVLFKIDYDQIISIPAGLNTLETYSFLLKDIPTNYTNLLTTFNFKDSMVTNIKPGSIRLQDELGILDFSRVEKVSLLASQAGFVNEKEIGYLETIPITSANTLQIFPTLVNAKDIFSKNTFDLRLKIKLRNFLNASTNIRLRFNMNAN